MSQFEHAVRDRNLGAFRFLMMAAMTLLMTMGGGLLKPAEAAPAYGCRESLVPVSLAPGRAASQKLFVKLCAPVGTQPKLVQLLVHGITSSNRYWDFPDPRDASSQRYSYVAAATAAGHATLSIDRIGTGDSSHPPSAIVDINLNAHVIHELVVALRKGSIAGPGNMRPAFDKVVLVGHSYGTALGWLVATRYQDVDGLVLTGFGHKMNPITLATLAPNFYPALLDPKFLFDRLDPGYLTHRNGARYSLFYAPAPADPKVVALDESLKETITALEFASITVAIGTPLDIRVPVLLVMGQVDSLFCAPQLGAIDCASAATLVRDEAPFLGSRVPSVDGYVLANAGHSLNLMQNAPDFFAAVQQWVDRRLAD